MRVVIKRARAEKPALQIYRWPAGGSPTVVASRFIFGQWRTHATAIHSESAATLLGHVQRANMEAVDGSTYEVIDQHAHLELCCLSWPRLLMNGVTSDLRKSESWISVLKTSALFIVTKVRFQIESENWWVIEAGELVPSPMAESILEGAHHNGSPQAAFFEVDAAAKKAYNEQAKKREDGAHLTVRFKGDALKGALPSAEQLSEALAQNYQQEHEKEDKERIRRLAREELERKMAEEARVKELAEEAERERRIAAGDVTVLDDASLAERLRRKRQKAS